MVLQQRVAWFRLAVLLAAFSAFVILWPLIGASPASGAFGICGLLGLRPFFYRERNKGEIDERDQLIHTRAKNAGFGAFWLLFVAACMVLWGVLRYGRQQETVSVDVFPILVLAGFFVFMLVHSVAILIEYGRSRDEE